MALPQQEFEAVSDRQGAASLFKKMAAIMSELTSFEPDTRHQQGYMFVSAPQVHDQLRKLMGKHGVAFIPSIESTEFVVTEGKDGKTNQRYRITQTFSLCCADTGYIHTVKWSGECLLAGANDDKAIHKAATLSQKHFLIRTFLGSVMDDPDADESHVETVGRSSQINAAQKGKPEPDSTSNSNENQEADSEAPTIELFMQQMKAHGFEKSEIKQALLDAGQDTKWTPESHHEKLAAVKTMVTANWAKQVAEKIEADIDPEPVKEEPKKEAKGIDFAKALKDRNISNGNGNGAKAKDEVVETKQSEDTVPFAAPPMDEIEIGVSYEDEEEDESSFEYK